jgi:hypothetical protein
MLLGTPAVNQVSEVPFRGSFIFSQEHGLPLPLSSHEPQCARSLTATSAAPAASTMIAINHMLDSFPLLL